MSSRLKDTQIGTGTNTGTAPLKFESTLDRKISYWSNGDSFDFGVGITDDGGGIGEIRHYVSGNNDLTKWGYGGFASPGFVETARLTAMGKMTLVDLQMTNGASNGHILTSDASGNATWQDPSTITNSFFDATVAPINEDYTSVKAAADAGHKRIFVKGNVTETANIDMTDNLYIYVEDGFTWALSTFKVNFGADNRVIYLRGNGSITSSGIAFDSDNGGGGDYSGTMVDSVGLDFVNTTALSNEPLFVTETLKLSNSKMDMPNIANSGIAVNTLEMENVTLDGKGALCEDIIEVSNAHISNLTLTGTFHPTNDIITALTADVTIDGLTYNSASNVNVVLGGHFSNFRKKGSGNLNIKLEFNGSTLSQAYLTGSSLTVGETGQTRLGFKISDCDFDSLSFAGNITGMEMVNFNAPSTSLVTINSTSADIRITNSSLGGGLTSNGDRIQISNSKMGVDGAGTATITFTASASNSIASGLLVEAAGSVAGTNNQSVNEVLY